MARESALWARLRGTAVPELLWKKHKVLLERIENLVSAGRPDVEGCIDSLWIFIELKSEMPGLQLRIGNAVLELTRDFDEVALKRFLSVLVKSC